MSVIKAVPHLFAVYKDGMCMMYTDSEVNVPAINIQKSMAKAGYKLKMNGKAYVPVARKKKIPLL